MTREDIATERALKMHDLALSVVRSKGVTKLEGSTTKFSPEVIERVGNRMRVTTIISGDIPRQETKPQNDANYHRKPLPRERR
jgi:hypothetical protein